MDIGTLVPNHVILLCFYFWFSWFFLSFFWLFCSWFSVWKIALSVAWGIGQVNLDCWLIKIGEGAEFHNTVFKWIMKGKQGREEFYYLQTVLLIWRVILRNQPSFFCFSHISKINIFYKRQSVFTVVIFKTYNTNWIS